MSHPLAIDEQIRGFIERVLNYAEENKISFDMTKEMIAGTRPPIGDNRNYVCYIPVGFRVAYSIEEQPCGWCRHMSVSVSTKDRVPSIPAVEMLMKEFGFEGTINDQLHVGMEDIGEGHRAVNVLAMIEL